jgi:hypothetical protein
MKKRIVALKTAGIVKIKWNGVISIIFFALLFSANSVYAGNSCVGNCGGNAGSCWCDDLCTGYGDCCSDYQSVCVDPDPVDPITPDPVTPDTYPESAHPYSNNFDNTWTYTASGNPYSITVTFDSQTYVENNYDFIYVMDGSGNNISGSPFTGSSLANQTVTVPGDTVKIRLTTDHSVTEWGFKVNSISTEGGIIDPIIPSLQAEDFVNVTQSASCPYNGYARIDFAMPSNQIGLFDYLKVAIYGPNNTKMILNAIPSLYGDIWELIQNESLSLIVDGVAEEIPIIGWSKKAYDIGKNILEIYEDHSDQSITGFMLESDVMPAMYSNQSYLVQFISDNQINSWDIFIEVEYHYVDYGTITPHQFLYGTVTLCD